jgi:hypothetical protein
MRLTGQSAFNTANAFAELECSVDFNGYNRYCCVLDSLSHHDYGKM